MPEPMTQLERQLRELGSRLDFPPTPELAAAVRARLTEEPARRRRPALAFRRRTLVFALAALLVGVGIAFAVPPARTAILHFFGFHGVRIERVPTLPPAPPPTRGNLDLGRRISFARAERLTPYRIAAPGGRRSGAVYYRDSPTGGEVSFLLRCCRPLLLLSELRGEAVPFVEKVIGPGTRIERLTIGGAPGYWISGAPHVLYYRAPDGTVYQESLRLAGNTLLWDRNGVTFRLEGAHLRKAQALRIAAGVR
jgi:hypothetical protein